ncbi:MAG: glycosyltransferase family 2 protein, partial [Candidatus Binatia bacterium]
AIEFCLRLTAADGRRRAWTRTLPAPAASWTPFAAPLAEFAEAEVDLALSARVVAGEAPNVAPLWGNPTILSRRRPREVAALARAYLALFGLRGGARKAWELARRPTFDRGDDYESWRRRRPERHARRPLRETDRETAPRPAPGRFSLLLRAADASPELVERTLASIRGQTRDDWQVCLALPAARAAALAAHPQVVVDTAAEPAWGALLTLAQGEFVAAIDAGDELAPHALAALAAAIERAPDVDVVYSDEDQIDAGGRHCQPFFKPDWSPEYFLASGYIGRLTALRRRAVDAAGGFRPALGSAQEFDLALRLIERGAVVRHVDDVLYHRRGAALPAWDTADAGRALREHFGRRGVDARGVPHAPSGLMRVRYALRERPVVSIVMPTGGRERLVGERRIDLLLNCLQTVVRSTYTRLEIICLDDGNLRPETRAGLAALGDDRIRLVSSPPPLNIAAKMNQGARMTSGEHLLFLNDDIEVVTPDWIEALLEFSQQPEIGVTGPKLLFPSGAIQHAGMAVADRVPIILFRWSPRDHPGYFGNLAVACNYSALIGACLMTRRDVFEAVGGFDERMPFIWHDLDYCFQARARGLRVVFTPYAELYHFETASRPTTFRSVDTIHMARKWGDALERDPFYNRHLRQDRADFRVGA